MTLSLARASSQGGRRGGGGDEPPHGPHNRVVVTESGNVDADRQVLGWLDRAPTLIARLERPEADDRIR